MIIIIKETAQMRIFLDFTNLLGDAVVWSRVWLFPGLKFAIQAQGKRVKLNGVGGKALRQRRQGRV